MNLELKRIIDQVSRDKGIDRHVLIKALEEALKQKGIRLLHCRTDVEQISNATTITKLRERAKG